MPVFGRIIAYAAFIVAASGAFFLEVLAGDALITLETKIGAVVGMATMMVIALLAGSLACFAVFKGRYLSEVLATVSLILVAVTMVLLMNPKFIYVAPTAVVTATSISIWLWRRSLAANGASAS